MELCGFWIFIWVYDRLSAYYNFAILILSWGIPLSLNWRDLVDYLAFWKMSNLTQRIEFSVWLSTALWAFILFITSFRWLFKFSFLSLFLVECCEALVNCPSRMIQHLFLGLCGWAIKDGEALISRILAYFFHMQM